MHSKKSIKIKMKEKLISSNLAVVKHGRVWNMEDVSGTV